MVSGKTPTKIDIRDLTVEGLPRVQKYEFLLNVFTTPAMSLCIPALVVRGAKARPLLMVTAGIHGNEYEGIEAVKEVYKELDPRQMRGSFLGLPICNIRAFETLSRVTPGCIDGLNLARVFPGRSAGQFTEMLAFNLMELVRRTVHESDLLVDLHSGGARYEFLPIVGYRKHNSQNAVRCAEAAHKFGLENVWKANLGSGTLTTAATKAGIRCIGAEVTGGGHCRKKDIDLYVNGTKNMLRFLEIIDGKPRIPENVIEIEMVEVYADESGFFLSSCKLGDFLRRGEPIGRIESPFGKVLAEVVAPRSGTIWALRIVPTIWRSELVAEIAYE